jgi:serine/threonine protein kinase
MLAFQHSLHLFLEEGCKDLSQYLYKDRPRIDATNFLKSQLNTSCLYPLATRETIEKEMYESLQWLQQHGLVHRDLKPANWMRMADDKFLLIDFDMTVATGIEVDIFGGTAPEYRYPSSDQMVSNTSHDFWSLGCSLLELRTRQRPFAMFDYKYALQRLSALLPEENKHILNLLQVQPASRS